LFRRLFVLALAPLAIWGQSSGAPSYSAAGLVNAATNLAGPLAPNSWATVYGSNLAWTTATAGLSDMAGNQLPTRISGAGVQVLFAGGTPGHLLFVSPTQVNFLVPASLLPGDTSLTIVRDGWAGPSIPITIAELAPGLFQSGNMVSAEHPDGTVVCADAPARPGEIIVLYGTGFGQTANPFTSQDDGRLVPLNSDLNAIRIQHFSDLAVTLNDTPVDSQRILWAGLTPGFAGLYQINLQLPDSLDPDPQIRVWIGDQPSAPGVKLAARP
jgi:uncharacterized protein (TIGR03437 family)